VGVWSAVAEPANNEELRGVFEGLDTDGSGGLDRSEVRRPLRPFWRPF
jgi:Ca2+-binding EF-hand superfamily protein